MRTATIILLAVFVSGCETSRTLHEFSEDRYYEVQGTDVEASLAKAGVPYRCGPELRKEKIETVCYVRRDLISSLRLEPEIVYEVPQSVLVDAGHTLLVIGQVLANSIAVLCANGNCPKSGGI